MKIPGHTLPASVLATVLVVCTLMLLTVLLVIDLWNLDITKHRLYHNGMQDRANVESGFLLYRMDSTLQNHWDADSSVLLFEGREDSGVRFTIERWGMYEVVKVEAKNGKKSSIRLLGKAAESDEQATLYIPENDRSLSLTGRTFLEGRVCLSRNGISYTQMRSEFFSGKQLKQECVRASWREFPELDGETRHQIGGLLARTRPEEWTACASVLKQGFSEVAVGTEIGEYLSGVRMEGHLILYAPDELFIEQDNCLENVIVVGRKVSIANGFTGSVQIFATDTISLGDRVCLKAGSGLYVKQEETGGLVELGEHNEINGFVVVESSPPADQRRGAAYIQPETSRVRGLVYVDGIAEVHGFITGSLYVRECCYFTPDGYYSGTLYNAILSGNPGLPYPLLMRGPYERKEVKWLY